MVQNSFDKFLNQLAITSSMRIDYRALTAKPGSGKWFRQCVNASIASYTNTTIVTTQLAVLRAFHMTHNLSGDSVLEYDKIVKSKLPAVVDAERLIELCKQIENMSQRIVVKSGLKTIKP